MLITLKYFVLPVLSLFLFLGNFSVVLATTKAPEIVVHIGGFDSLPPAGDSEGYKEIAWIGQYIAAIYQYGVGLAVVLAVVVIMAAGFLYLVSAGSQEKVKVAKDYILSALTGLFLALFSYLILYTVNPRLVNLSSLVIGRPADIESRLAPERNGSLGDAPQPYYVAGAGDPRGYIRANEGVRYEVYRDSLGNLTYGVGHLVTPGEINPVTGRPYQVGDSVSPALVESTYLQDYQQAANDAARFAGNSWNNLSPDRQTVLTDMAFNMGGAGLNGFTQLQAAVRSSNWTAAGYEITNSRYGNLLPGRAGRNASIMVNGSMSF